MSNRTVIMLLEKGFQDQEVIYPYYRLQEAGFKVETAGPESPVVGKYGIPIKATMPFTSLWQQTPAGVVIPGGWQCPERLRMNQLVLDFVKRCWGDQNVKAIGAICHGPWVLASAGVLKGVMATCYEGIKDDIVNAGATHTSAARAIMSGKLVTAQHYDDNPAFMGMFLAKLNSGD